MKQLKCEMCGGTDFVKQDGMFVCQSCGLKYTPEEAKKVMVEGTVEVKGSVQIDNSNEVSNYLELARRANQTGDNETAKRYYDLIQRSDPYNWESVFYSVYCDAIDCKIAEIESSSMAIANIIDIALGLIKNHLNDEESQLSAIKEVSSKCMKSAEMFRLNAEKFYKNTEDLIKNDFIQDYVDNIFGAIKIYFNLGDSLEKHFLNKEGAKENMINAWEEGVIVYRNLIQYLKDKETNKQTIEIYLSKIKAYDPDYVKDIEDKELKEKEILRNKQLQEQKEQEKIEQKRESNAKIDTVINGSIIGICVIVSIVLLVSILVVSDGDDVLYAVLMAIGIPLLLAFSLFALKSGIEDYINDYRKKHGK